MGPDDGRGGDEPGHRGTIQGFSGLIYVTLGRLRHLRPIATPERHRQRLRQPLAQSLALLADDDYQRVQMRAARAKAAALQVERAAVKRFTGFSSPSRMAASRLAKAAASSYERTGGVTVSRRLAPLEVVEPGGIEPPTSTLRTSRSPG